MTETPGILGQLVPGASLEDLYTVPEATSCVVSSFVVCNRSGSARTCRLSVAKAGEADAPKQYLYYDSSIPANDTLVLTGGLTLAATDVLRCYGSTSDVTFQVFGVEITA